MKKLFIIYLFFSYFSILKAQENPLTKPKSLTFPEKILSSFKPQPIQISEDAFCWLTERDIAGSFEHNLISYSKKFLGVRYRYAGNSPYGFDCSGFTSFIYSRFGFSLARSAPGQSVMGMDVDREDAKKGDLIFFKGRNWKSKYVGHVGLVISNESGKITFIHASVCCGIIIESTDVPYYSSRFIKVSRLSDLNS